MVKKLNKLLIVVTCMFIAGCSIDYSDPSEEVEKSETIPDSVMKNFMLIQIRNNDPYTQITSSLTEIYNKQNRTVLYDVEFTEYNLTTNDITTTGKVDIVEYFNDSEDAKLTGNIIFYSKKDEIEIFGDDLYWNDDDKSMSSDVNSSILVIKEDGSRIEGFGFSANLKNSTFSFEKNVTGITP